MDREHFDRWALTRRNGRGSFIWWRGVVGFGGMMALVLGAVLFAGRGRRDYWDVLILLPFLCLICLGAGSVFGRWLWEYLENEYQRAAIFYRIGADPFPGTEVERDQPPNRPKPEGSNVTAEMNKYGEAGPGPRPKAPTGAAHGALARRIVAALVDAGIVESRQGDRAAEVVLREISGVGGASAVGD
jgi:hypothetical protein